MVTLVGESPPSLMIVGVSFAPWMTTVIWDDAVAFDEFRAV